MISKRIKSLIFLRPPPTTFNDYDILCSSGNDVCNVTSRNGNDRINSTLEVLIYVVVYFIFVWLSLFILV